jgi:hypothetical protein
MPSQFFRMLLAVLSLALLSACAPVVPAVTTESSVTADSGADEAAAQTRGVLRMPHFLPRGGAESLDPASPTEFSYANYLLYDRLG